MNIQKILDERPMSAAQIGIVLVCFVLNMLDGMDVVVAAYVAPRIIDEWGISSQSFGMVFSAALIGMATGAMFISPGTDLIGRRLMVLFSVFVVTIGMFATALTDSITGLVLWRLFTGLGIGSMLASLTSLVAEYSSNRRRNLVIGFVLGGYPVGATMTGLMAAWLIPEFGWRAMFIAGGILSTIMIPVVLLMLPESLEFLLKRQPQNALAKINRVLARLQLDRLDQLPAIEANQAGAAEKGPAAMFRNIATLMSPEYRGATLRLWLAFFMAFFTMYFLLSWIPKISEDTGLSPAQGAYAGAIFNLGSFFGIVVLGQISNGFGLRRSIFVFMILSAVLMVVFGLFRFSVPVYMSLLCLLGFFVQGGFVGLYSVAARLYPMEIRTTGIGWGIGLGRFGAIISPALGGMAIGAGMAAPLMFTLFAIPFVIGAIAEITIRNERIA